jgi:hypothetical protein
MENINKLQQIDSKIDEIIDFAAILNRRYEILNNRIFENKCFLQKIEKRINRFFLLILFIVCFVDVCVIGLNFTI